MKKVSKGKYLYNGYSVYNIGYYPPDQRVVWEGMNLETGEADYHGYSKKEVKGYIDEDLTNNHKENQ